MGDNAQGAWLTRRIVDAMIAGADVRTEMGTQIWDKAERSTMREASDLLLGEINMPTQKLIEERVVRINDLCVTMNVHAVNCGLRIRFPKPVRVCCGVRWDGSFAGRYGPHDTSESLDLSEAVRRIKSRTPTPKERAKALSALRWIEKWIVDRIAGVERYAVSLRQAQSKWEDELKSELAMQDLGANTPAKKPKEEDDDGAFKGVADARKIAQVDPYEVLGVDPETPWPEIVTAFREAAHVTHPDHGGDPDLFRAVMSAFDRLKKTRKK